MPLGESCAEAGVFMVLWSSHRDLNESDKQCGYQNGERNVLWSDPLMTVIQHRVTCMIQMCVSLYNLSITQGYFSEQRPHNSEKKQSSLLSETVNSPILSQSYLMIAEQHARSTLRIDKDRES